MNNWITYLWQSNVCLMVFFLGYTLWLRKEQCFKYRRLYLVIGCLLSLALPLLPLPVISQWFSNSVVFPVSIILPEIVSYSGPGQGWTQAGILIGIYTFGCLLIGSFIMFRVGKTMSLINKCDRSSETYRGHTIYLTQGHFPTSSYFNFLFWDNKRDTGGLHKRLILDHEIIHIHQGHSYDIMFLELLKVAFWFNPVVWYLLKELRNVH